MRRCLRRASGQGVVEFALVSLLLFPLIFGVIEFGWLLYAHHEVTSAAREGARYASVHGARSQGLTAPDDIAAYRLDAADVKTAILQKLSIPGGDALTVAVGMPDGTLAPRNRVQIDVSYPYHPLISYVLPLPTLTLAARSTMIVHF